MGREVRMVTPDWKHPKSNGHYIPLKENYESDLEDFRADIAKMGLSEAIDCWGGGPEKEDYMLVGVSAEKRTHYMMYEYVSEGTPKSPSFETPEKLAHWLADNGASSFGRSTATYEQWLRVCKGGYAPSAIYTPETGIISGVEAKGVQ